MDILKVSALQRANVLQWILVAQGKKGTFSSELSRRQQRVLIKALTYVLCSLRKIQLDCETCYSDGSPNFLRIDSCYSRHLLFSIDGEAQNLGRLLSLA